MFAPGASGPAPWRSAGALGPPLSAPHAQASVQGGCALPSAAAARGYILCAPRPPPAACVAAVCPALLDEPSPRDCAVALVAWGAKARFLSGGKGGLLL